MQVVRRDSNHKVDCPLISILLFHSNERNSLVEYIFRYVYFYSYFIKSSL